MRHELQHNLSELETQELAAVSVNSAAYKTSEIVQSIYIVNSIVFCNHPEYTSHFIPRPSLLRIIQLFLQHYSRPLSYEEIEAVRKHNSPAAVNRQHFLKSISQVNELLEESNIPLVIIKTDQDLYYITHILR